jgi:hypothetical protein
VVNRIKLHSGCTGPHTAHGRDPTSRRRSGAENAQGGGDCKCKENFLSIHADLLPSVCRGDCAAS